jgi:LPS sulfotransferase NodH
VTRLTERYDGSFGHYLSDRHDLPPFNGQARFYLIASTPRSGSELLAQLLYSTRLVGAPFEYFKPTFFWYWRRRIDSSDPEEVLHGIVARRTGSAGWFGIKVHRPHLRYLRSLVDYRPEVVVRTRRHDVVDQAVSLAIALQTGAWTSLQPALAEPRYDRQAIADAQATIRRMDASWDAHFEKSGFTPLTVFYEDVVRAPRQALTGLFDAFGLRLPPEGMVPETRKQADRVNQEWKSRYLAGD